VQGKGKRLSPSTLAREALDSESEENAYFIEGVDEEKPSTSDRGEKILKAT